MVVLENNTETKNMVSTVSANNFSCTVCFRFKELQTSIKVGSQVFASD